jgi:hypothetical protein
MEPAKSSEIAAERSILTFRAIIRRGKPRERGDNRTARKVQSHCTAAVFNPGLDVSQSIRSQMTSYFWRRDTAAHGKNAFGLK